MEKYNKCKHTCQHIAKSTGLRCKKNCTQRTKYCHWHQKGGDTTKNYFKEGSDLREDEKKWCRCVLHVASKQSDQCLVDVNKNARKTYDGKTCYNIYAVCSSRVGTSSRKCGINYEFNNIPDNELIAYSKMKHIKIPVPYSRNNMITAIMEWKKREK